MEDRVKCPHCKTMNPTFQKNKLKCVVCSREFKIEPKHDFLDIKIAKEVVSKKEKEFTEDV